MNEVMRIKLSPAAISKAVDLWKGLLANPKYDNLGDTGTPQERFDMGMASMLAMMIPKNNTSEMLDAFGDALEKILAQKTIHPQGYYYLGVDYGPCQELAQAADAVGLKMEWPWKTGMWIKQDSVDLSAGYRAPIQTFKLDSVQTTGTVPVDE